MIISNASSDQADLSTQYPRGGQQARDETPPFCKYRDIHIMDDVEPLENYEPGGLIPLTIGSTLIDRFEVYYKFGFGVLRRYGSAGTSKRKSGGRPKSTPPAIPTTTARMYSPRTD